MKKVISVLLATLCLCIALALPAFAAEYRIVLHDDLAGLDYTAQEQIIEYSDNLTPHNIQINDYVGNVILTPMKPGRTYGILHCFSAVEGTTLPEQLDESNTIIECDKGASCYWYSICVGAQNSRSAEFYTTVTVKGTPWQMFWGRICDFWAKVFAWSPY